MSIANDIINGQTPDFDRYLREGELLDNIDEYGFTPLIETAITKQPAIAKRLLERGVNINKTDVTGRTALHWAVDNDDPDMARVLLEHGANHNAYTRAGLPVLVYPVLRRQSAIKQLLYHSGAKLDFALDFIYAKLIGHRFELKGDVDIVTAADEFIELDYEGFILEFTVAVIKDSLRRFTSSYSTKHLRHHFSSVHAIMDAFSIADELLQLQRHVMPNEAHFKTLERAIRAPMQILPAASRGHALAFIKYGDYWAKIDRGENSLKEGSVIIYRMSRPDAFDVNFLHHFLYKKQSRQYFHQAINKQLGLIPIAQIPMSSQIVGNCSWANIQAIVPVAYALQHITNNEAFSYDEALKLYDAWVEWDKDRALDECIQRFYLGDVLRKASYASILAGVLFQSCDYAIPHHVERADKILKVLTLSDYYYILQSYLDTYCIKKLTRKGNNLLKLLDECGVDPKIGINPIATGLLPRE